MFRSVCLFVLPLALDLCGCAIYPSPENVTGFDPYAIERHIRCEMKDALQAKFIALVRAVNTPAMNALADELDADRSKFRNLLHYRYDPIIAFYLKKYYNAAVAYDFTFDVTEDNEADAGADFLPGISSGTFKLGVHSMGDLSRQGISQFQATDTFGPLMSDTIVCDTRMTGENYAYPITGTIGVAKPLRQFIDLNEFGHLTKTAGGDSAADKVPTYSSTFNFQTTISVSVNPQLTLSPVIRGVGDAAFNTSAKRIDIHKLILGFSLPAPDKKNAVTVDLLGISSPSLGAAKTATENQALKAAEAARVRQFLDNFGKVPLQ